MPLNERSVVFVLLMGKTKGVENHEFGGQPQNVLHYSLYQIEPILYVLTRKLYQPEFLS